MCTQYNIIAELENSTASVAMGCAPENLSITNAVAPY